MAQLNEVEQALAVAREQWRRRMGTYGAVLKAERALQALTIQTIAVDCPQCEGRGDVPVGVTRGGMDGPPEVVTEPCDFCNGACKVLPTELAEWKENNE